jgi:hypothetical protein
MTFKSDMPKAWWNPTLRKIEKNVRVSPLNLISTPTPVLNSLGLRLRVGLSSEDPMVSRHPTEAYEAYLSLYSPEGLLLERVHMGQIPPSRRRFFNVSAIAGRLVPNVDHLAVVHRIPSRLMTQVSNVEEDMELEKEPDYSLVRSVVEYSFPQGGNGSVIYETTPKLNATPQEGKSSNTLTFTCQTVLSDVLDTYVVLIHYSMNPAYSQIANYQFALHGQSGELVAADQVEIGPFSIKVLDMAQIISKDAVACQRDARDGVSSFTFVGYSENAALQVIVVNAAPSLRAVAVEHTHPPQTYLFPWDSSYQREAKTAAQRAWQFILSPSGRNKL